MSRPDRFSAFDFDVVTGPPPNQDDGPREAAGADEAPAAATDAGPAPSAAGSPA
jgi:hypothetical protein